MSRCHSAVVRWTGCAPVEGPCTRDCEICKRARDFEICQRVEHGNLLVIGVRVHCEKKNSQILYDNTFKTHKVGIFKLQTEGYN